jgi:imidazolonepropionase-like amidohydrolase
MKTILLSLAALAAAPAPAQMTAIVGGTVAIGDGSQPLENGTVVFRDGRIVSAGKDVQVPAGATVIDAHGKWVAAGIVAGFTDIGITEVMVGHEGSDVRAPKSPFSAALDIAPAVNTRSAVVGLERAGGVTRAIVSSEAAGSIFGGEGAVIDLGLGSEPVTRARAFEYVELGEAGGQEAGGSRPAAYAMLHEALAEAADYRRNPAAFGGREKDSLVKRPDAATLLSALDGKTPLLVHVERASDILSVLELRKEYPTLRLVLLGATEGWMVAQQIAAAHVPVIAAALSDLPEDFERLAATESNVGRLDRAGVVVALSTINQTEPQQQRRLTQLAGNLVGFGRLPGATGLDWGRAFAAITSRPAQALGLDGEIGSLRPGRRADVVVWDHDPLELSSAPVMIFIDGISQPTTSRQTELRDRYMTPSDPDLPKAYKR